VVGESVGPRGGVMGGVGWVKKRGDCISGNSGDSLSSLILLIIRDIEELRGAESVRSLREHLTNDFRSENEDEESNSVGRHPLHESISRCNVAGTALLLCGTNDISQCEEEGSRTATLG